MEHENTSNAENGAMPEIHDHEYLHEHGIAHEHTHAHTHEHTKAVLNRLSRAIGHLQSVRTMVEDDLSGKIEFSGGNGTQVKIELPREGLGESL